MTERRRGILLRAAAIALVLGSILINIKNIFTSCQIDAEYQVAMAYRLLRGDAMFSEMWEAHQTSAFFLTFFEWIFLKVTGSTTGIMVYANAVGVLCKIAVAFAVYGTLQRFADKKSAFAALIFVLNAYPKESVLPDFANLQIWFALLLMCCMIQYFFGSGKLKWLVLGALCLCLEVLAYPSCALVWILCVVLFALYSAHKMRDICLFTGLCGVCGLLYLLYFMRGDPGRFAEQLYYIWSGDESHAVGPAVRFAQLGRDLAAIGADMRYIAVAAIGALIFAVLCYMAARRGEKGVGQTGNSPQNTSGELSERLSERFAGRKFFQAVLTGFVGFYILGYLFFLRMESAGTKYHFFILYFFVEIAAFFAMRYLEPAEKKIFTVGQCIGFGGFAATLLLSDLGLIPTISYLIPNICVCFLPLGRLAASGACGEKEAEEAGRGGQGAGRGAQGFRWGYLPALLLCAVMLFRNLVYLNGWMVTPSNFREDSVFGVNWTAQYGPLKGIVSREGTYVADVSYQEWLKWISPGDRVLVLSYPMLTATVYLYEDVEICADSTISTPTYSERLFRYWEENPGKYPNVVIAKCYAGNLMIGEYNEVVRWLLEDFQADEVVDGTFWRYYIRRE